MLASRVVLASRCPSCSARLALGHVRTGVHARYGAQHARAIVCSSCNFALTGDEAFSMLAAEVECRAPRLDVDAELRNLIVQMHPDRWPAESALAAVITSQLNALRDRLTGEK